MNLSLMKTISLFMSVFFGVVFRCCLRIWAELTKFRRLLSTTLNGTSFQAKLKDGFHFNEAAPNQITIDGKGYRPKSLKPHEVIFQFANAKFSTGHASLYICDDALTFCQPHTIELKSGSESQDSRAVQPAKRKKVSLNEFGFINDDLQAASDRAVKEKKMVLIDFLSALVSGLHST